MVDARVQSTAEILFLDELSVLWHEVAFCVRFTVTSRCELAVRLFFVGEPSSLHSVSSGLLRRAIFDHICSPVEELRRNDVITQTHTSIHHLKEFKPLFLS